MTKLNLNRHSKSYNWLPFGRGWDEHTARVKITSKRKVSEGLSPILPKRARLGDALREFPSNFAISTRPLFRFNTPQAGHLRQRSISIHFADRLFVSSRWYVLLASSLHATPWVSPSRSAGHLPRLRACCPSCACRRRTSFHHRKLSRYHQLTRFLPFTTGSRGRPPQPYSSG